MLRSRTEGFRIVLFGRIASQKAKDEPVVSSSPLLIRVWWMSSGSCTELIHLHDDRFYYKCASKTNSVRNKTYTRFLFESGRGVQHGGRFVRLIELPCRQQEYRHYQVRCTFSVLQASTLSRLRYQSLLLELIKLLCRRPHRKQHWHAIRCF